MFFLIGAPAAIGVGYLSGIYSRKLLLFAVVLLGEGPVILTYFVKTYAGFFILRALTGLSLGGCFPLVFSILGDLVGPEQRSSVSSILAIATGGGTAIGQGIAGFAGPSVGWRASFLIVGFPTIALAIYMLIRVKEPRRVRGTLTCRCTCLLSFSMAQQSSSMESQFFLSRIYV